MGSYTMTCNVRADCTRLVKANLDEVAKLTNTSLSLTPGGPGFQKLTISGRVPDAYTAHMKLMWAVKTDERNLTSMEDGIADIQTQLVAMKQEQTEEEESAQWQNWDD